jgi:hypothetical protein
MQSKETSSHQDIESPWADGEKASLAPCTFSQSLYFQFLAGGKSEAKLWSMNQPSHLKED